MINYKRNEDKIIEAIKQYIDSTYSGHYNGKGDIQAVDVWDACGISKESYISNIIKYAMRFGKKGGENPKDIMKIIHYSIFLLNEVMENSKNVNETPSE